MMMMMMMMIPSEKISNKCGNFYVIKCGFLAASEALSAQKKSSIGGNSSHKLQSPAKKFEPPCK